MQNGGKPLKTVTETLTGPPKTQELSEVTKFDPFVAKYAFSLIGDTVVQSTLVLQLKHSILAASKSQLPTPTSYTCSATSYIKRDDGASRNICVMTGEPSCTVDRRGTAPTTL